MIGQMWGGVMSSTRSDRVGRLGGAFRFAVTAWRGVWLILLAASIGPMVMFLGEHAPVSRDQAMELMLGGGVWTALMLVPVTGGLYRSALSELAAPAGRQFNLGAFGLQWGKTEWRLVGLMTLLFLLSVLFLVPAALVTTAVAFVLRSQADMSMVAALRIGAFAGLAIVALFPITAVRVSLGGAATVAEDSLRLFQTWPMTSRRFWTVAGPLAVITSLYPIAMTAAAIGNLQITGDFALGVSRWPVAIALTGAVLSGLFHGAVMPALYAGFLTRCYLDWRAPSVQGAVASEPDLNPRRTRPREAMGRLVLSSPERPLVMPQPVLAMVPEAAASHPLQLAVEPILWPAGFVGDALPLPSVQPDADFERHLDQGHRVAVNFEEAEGPGKGTVFPDHDVEHGLNFATMEHHGLEHPLLLAPDPVEIEVRPRAPTSSDPSDWVNIDAKLLSEIFRPGRVWLETADQIHGVDGTIEAISGDSEFGGDNVIPFAPRRTPEPDHAPVMTDSVPAAHQDAPEGSELIDP